MPKIEVRPIMPEQWRVLKDVRLRALADAPEAFSTTLAQAQGWSESEWRQRAARFSMLPPAAGYLAYADGVPCGMASCYLPAVGGEADGRAAELTAFWVAPERRGQGVGAALVECIAEWAAAQGVETLQAWVMETNHGATAFYKKAGFQETGQREPDAPDGSKWMMLMTRALGPQAISPTQGRDAGGIGQE